jgi:hypothetical protein
MTCGSSVIIVSDYRLDDRSSFPGRDTGFFRYPPSLLSSGYKVSFPGGKARLGRDADHLRHLTLRSKVSRSYSSSTPYSLHGEWRGSFVFTANDILLSFLSTKKPLLKSCMHFLLLPYPNHLRRPSWSPRYHKPTDIQ